MSVSRLCELAHEPPHSSAANVVCLPGKRLTVTFRAIADHSVEPAPFSIGGVFLEHFQNRSGAEVGRALLPVLLKIDSGMPMQRTT